MSTTTPRRLPMERPSARESGTGGTIELRFPFSRDLVDDLKATIPPRHRRWDATEKVWRVLGASAPDAIALLVAHFPAAEVPGDAPRRLPSPPARTAPPVPPDDGPPWDAQPWWDDPSRPAPERPLMTLLPAPSPPAEAPAPIVAMIPCPKCHVPYEQPIRVIAETSRTVAKREQSPPELIAVCPHCRCLAVVSFFPAVAAATAS